MRLLILSLAVIATSLGGLAAYRLSADKPESSFASAYLTMAHDEPIVLSGFIADALPPCLPPAFASYAQDKQLLDFATQILLRSGVMMAEGKSPEESSEEMVPWVQKEAESRAKVLSQAQQKRMVVLLRDGMNTEAAQRCIFTTLRTRLNSDFPRKIMTWKLRLGPRLSQMANDRALEPEQARNPL